jgi:hypothetical protein
MIRLQSVDESEGGNNAGGSDVQGVGSTGVLSWSNGGWHSGDSSGGWLGWVLDLTVTLEDVSECSGEIVNT